MPPPLPANDLQVVSIDSLEAALAKLAIKVSVNDIVSVIREEEEAKLALNPPEQSSGLQFTTTSKFIADPPKPAKADPLAKERRRRLLDLTKQTFPDGKVPDPFTLTWLALSQDADANHLPFIASSPAPKTRRTTHLNLSSKTSGASGILALRPPSSLPTYSIPS
ncbi:hypothetical protein BKA93DRAFT_740662 [Sparassis latifolia]